MWREEQQSAPLRGREGKELSEGGRVTGGKGKRRIPGGENKNARRNLSIGGNGTDSSLLH